MRLGHIRTGTANVHFLKRKQKDGSKGEKKRICQNKINKRYYSKKITLSENIDKHLLLLNLNRLTFGVLEQYCLKP